MAAKSKPDNAGKNKRDNNGRWPKGTSGNPNGRPKGSKYLEKAAELKDALAEAFTHEDIVAIAEKAIRQARNGDAAARNWCSDRLWGRPPQDVNLGNQENGPLMFGWAGKCPKK